MNCAMHTDVPAAAYCRTCGKPLCEECKRDIHGVIYCQDCLAARVHDTMPAAGAPAAGAAAPAPGQVVLAQPVTGANPALAGFLGAIPFGVGAVYNGQYAKGLVHLAIFIGLVYGANNAGSMDFVFGIAIPFFIVYQIIDAVRTAKARQYGMPLPDDMLGLSRLGGIDTAENRPPLGAIILLVLGVLFLLGNAGWFSWHWIDRFWPLALIAAGVWLIYRRQSASRGGPQ
jgi:hypothetical protein